MKVKIGLDQFDKKWPKQLTGARVGLLVHPASVNRKLEQAVDLFRHSKKCELKIILGPQHGIYGETQDNMIEWEGFQDRKTGLPVFSLYSKRRKPSPDMLEEIDTLVVDLQDVGSRYYTFIWTLELCMQACTELGKDVVILDRPNPLGGKLTEGPVLDQGYSSFVGLRPLPVRHGMTIAEIGQYLKNEFYDSLNLYAISLEGYDRNMWFDETGVPWVMPSPNMPALETATVYPGMCLLEGTNLSEGRGTTRPFEIFGAPFINPDILVKRLGALKLPGVHFRPLYFQPTFQKHAGKLCGGAQIHVINRNKFRSFKTGVAIITVIKELYSKHFRWTKPPYEYEKKKMPFDILAGSDRLRKDLEKGRSIQYMQDWWSKESQQFNRRVRSKYLMY